MPDVFSEAMDEFIDAFSTEAAVKFEYHRGTDFQLITTGWMDRTGFRVNEEDRSKLEWDDRDYVIPVVDLKLNGDLIIPQEGDWLKQLEPVVSEPSTYRLFAPNNEQVWRYFDIQEKMFLLHTKRFKF